MAQRNSPSRRIPDEPLAGILRTVAFQARYSNRRRSDVPTITSRVGQAASAEAASVVVGLMSQDEPMAATPATMEEALATTETPPEQPEKSAATRVATDIELPRNEAATLQVDGDGRATWQYEDRGTLPHVVATAVADQPAVATVSGVTATAVTVHLWDLTGQPVAGGHVSLTALWP
jgi:hypothetical protein